MTFVVGGEAVEEGFFGNRYSGEFRQIGRKTLKLGSQILFCMRRVGALREVEKRNVRVGEVTPPDSGEIPCHIAYVRENNGVHPVEFSGKAEFEGATGDRADKRLDARVGVIDLDNAPRAHESDGQHPGCGDDLTGGENRKASYNAGVRVVIFPAIDLSVRVADELAAG